MKINDLYPAALVIILVAILVGVGMTVIANVSQTVRTSSSGNDTFNASNETTIDLFNDFITTTSATYLMTNTSTNPVGANCFEWDDTGDYAGDKVLLQMDVSSACDNVNNSLINVSYTYGASNAAQVKLDASITAIGGFVTWFTIIVVMIAAGIIIGIMIKSFGGRS